MSLEISFKQDSNSNPQHLSLQDGESLQVFSGESFQIKNPEIVAQLVPQANDLQIVCHDGSTFILKSFLDVDFSQEPVLELKDGNSITWHDFVQQSDGVDMADLPDDQYSQSILFAPLAVIAVTSESQKWDLAQYNPDLEDRARDAGITNSQADVEPQEQPEQEPEDDHASANAIQDSNTPADPAEEKSEPENSNATPENPQNGNPIAYTTSTDPELIAIDIRDFIPQFQEDGLSDGVTITAQFEGGDPSQIEVDTGKGLLRLGDDAFNDDSQRKILITINDGDSETGKAITVTETKDGGGQAFHLILSHDRIAENIEGGLIGKLDTNDFGQGNNYTYEIVGDESSYFEVVGNVLKLKDGVSIDYEAQPDRYPMTIASIDQDGNRIEQTLSVWPEDVNEAASVSSVGLSGLEDVVVSFNPEQFEESFEDEDSDYLEMIRIDSLPDNGVIKIDGEPVTQGQLIDIDQVEDMEFHPDINWNGETNFSWSGFDGQSWSTESSPVSINVEAVNNALVVQVNIGNEAVENDTDFQLDLPENAFTDVDFGDALTYSAELPAWLEIDPETGSLSGTPSEGDCRRPSNNDHSNRQLRRNCQPNVSSYRRSSQSSSNDRPNRRSIDKRRPTIRI